MTATTSNSPVLRGRSQGIASNKTSPNTVAHLRREKPPQPEVALTGIHVYALQSAQENRSD